jgi:flagellar assembly factor FliW
MFQYTTGATTKKIVAKTDTMPSTVKIIHTQKAFDQDNKLIGFEQTEYFKLQASSEFQKAYQERTAYAPTLSFKLVDPRRADKLYRQTLFIPYTPPAET